MLRVGYVVPGLPPASGWRMYATGLLGALRQEGIDPVLFVKAGEQNTARELFPGCATVPLPSTHAPPPSRSWQDLRLIRTYIRSQRRVVPTLDLVHSMEAFPTGLVGHWVARRNKVPHLLTAHGTYGVVWHRNWIDRSFFRAALRGSSAVVTGSQGTAERMERYFGSAMSNTIRRTILYGNDFYQTVSRTEALKELRTPVVLSVGSVKPRKGFHVSLEAFGEVRKTVPDARYLIAGTLDDPAYLDDLRRLVSNRGIGGVEFLGEVSDADLDRLYKQASVFLLASQDDGWEFEGFGLVFLEAGAYGLPVVACRGGGIASAVQDGITGLLCGLQDVSGISTAITRLLTDGRFAARLGRANRDWAEKLTWQRAAVQYLSLYVELLASASSVQQATNKRQRL